MSEADSLTPEQWGGLLSDVEPPTYGEVPLALEDRLGLSPDQARAMVDAALDDGQLVEDDSGTFTVLTLAEGAEPPPGGIEHDEDETPHHGGERATQSTEENDRRAAAPVANGWIDVDFYAPEPDHWPASWKRRAFWMARKGKKPYAPWGDPNDPDAPCTRPEHDADYCDACSCDARYKWSVPDNWATKEVVDKWVDMDPSLDGYVVLLEKEDDPYTDDPDPYVLVDGDDVRCHETNEVHPKFLEILDRLGLTYADVSTSGAGVHALYEGQLPDGIKRAAFDIDTEPWGENDDVPGIEIYDGKRVCVVTGEHVAGTPTDVEPWNTDAAEAILDEYVPVEDRAGAEHDTDRDTPELEDYEPTATRGDETTDEIRDVFAAIDRLGVYDLPLKTSHVGTDGTGWEKWDPSTYRSSSGNDSLHTPDRKAWFDQKTGHSFGVLSLYAAEQGIISKPWHDLRGADFWTAVDTARDAGAPIPRLENGGDGNDMRYVEECTPPLTADAEPIDVDARREEMAGDAFDRFVDGDGLTIGAYNPGEGKTTSASIGAAERDRPHVVALPKHENCREFQRDTVKPDGYFHLKGAAQPIGDECMDASIADRECHDHGHTSACPSMCPVYDLDADDPLRQTFDALSGTVGTRKAHAILGLFSEDWHGDSCAWLEQWDDLESAGRVVTVHQYLTLKSVREHGDVLVDDAAGSFGDETTLSIEQLSRCRQALRRYASNELVEDRITDTLRLLDVFLDDVLDALTEGDDTAGRVELSKIDAPTFPATTRTYDSLEAIPDHISDDEIRETRTKRYVGDGGQYVYEHVYEIVTNDLAETLAQARRHYDDVVIGNMREGKWNGTPLCLDVVYGALAAALVDENDARAARVAAGFDVTLDTCPRCTTRLEARDGAKMCDECGWHEEHSRLTQDQTPPARIDVDVSTTQGGIVEGLVARRLPDVSALPDPDNVLILDATPQTAVYAAVFGVDPETVRVEGSDAYSLPNATVTQFVNGAYHRGTIEKSAVARRNIQRSLEKIDAMHDDVVYVSARRVRDLFEWPDTSADDVLYYYALRGLDARRDADAIVLVGAPHPDESDLRAAGRLLAIDNPGVRAGGRELSTRDAPEAGEPVYRLLNYVDDDGTGRAVAAKRYSGIAGDLFDARHANELVQAAHRIRPLLADESDEKHIYLLTNVPTDLPVDRLTTFDDFLDPLSGHVDIRDSALELLGAMVDSAKDDENDAPYVTDGGLLNVAGTASEWHDAAERAGVDVSQPTVSRALSDLRDAGLVAEGEYAQRRGRLQTLTRLGASVASIGR